METYVFQINTVRWVQKHYFGFYTKLELMDTMRVSMALVALLDKSIEHLTS